MTLQDNPNPRPERDTRRRASENPGWGIPLAIGAFILVGGLVLFGVGDRRMYTATNTAPGSSTQVQTQTPPPATTPPKQ